MEESLRSALHLLLDRMIDNKEEYGVFEHLTEPEMMKTINPKIPSVWKFLKTRVEIVMRIREEIDYV